MTATRRLSALALLLAALLAFAQYPPPERAARTEWFRDAGFGLFVHYLAGIHNNADSVLSLGKQTDWDACVREFDTERFADAAAEAGAGYVIFTVMQVSRFMIAPNATFDRISGYQPGEACATRDLIADLAASLGKRNIRLMLYYTGDGPRADEKAGPAFGCAEKPGMDFVKKWADVFREYGERYGDQVAGVWTDGCYQWLGYDEERLAVLAEGLRAGHPDRIIAFNPGVDPVIRAYSAHEDYTCGEQNRFYETPAARFLNGEQWHILSFLSGTWWGEPGLGYKKAEFVEYVRQVTERGGVVSVDVALFRDGSLDKSQVEMLKAVRKALNEPAAAAAPVPPGNLAWRKQSRLLSLDGARTLGPSCETQFARLGVDGSPETCAQAAGEYAWTYEADLVDTVAVRRVRATFAKKGYPTVCEVRVSADGQHWKSVHRAENHDGAPLEIVLDTSEQARYVRVCAEKPDGPGQPGGQMAVAELEVHADGS